MVRIISGETLPTLNMCIKMLANTIKRNELPLSNRENELALSSTIMKSLYILYHHKKSLDMTKRRLIYNVYYYTADVLNVHSLLEFSS